MPRCKSMQSARAPPLQRACKDGSTNTSQQLAGCRCPGGTDVKRPTCLSPCNHSNHPRATCVSRMCAAMHRDASACGTFCVSLSTHDSRFAGNACSEGRCVTAVIHSCAIVFSSILKYGDDIQLKHTTKHMASSLGLHETSGQKGFVSDKVSTCRDAMSTAKCSRSIFAVGCACIPRR